MIDLRPEEEPLTWRFWRKRRYIVVLMTFLGCFNLYAMRVNLSVGIVAMTEYRYIEYENGTIGYEQEFKWSSTEKGLILSSFFYGYILTQFPGGYISAKVGGHLLFGLGCLTTAILTILTPLAAKGGMYILIAVRVVEGIFEGVSAPSTIALWARWAPPYERSRMLSLMVAGVHMGTVISMPVCGVLEAYFGWESIFYFFGAISLIWYILWVLFISKDPATDKYISKDELRYIQESLGNVNKYNIKPPWKSIFTSPAVIAICVANFSENWGFYTLLTQLPTFLKDTLDIELEKIGFLSGAPYLVMAILLPVFGYLADFCQAKKYLTTTQVRKYFNTIGFLTQTIFMLLAAYLLSPTGSIICLMIAVGIGSISFSGFGFNHLDIAPQYASILLGITNTFGTIPGMLSPILAGYLVQNKLASEWQIVFFIAAGMYLIGSIIYWCNASGEIQQWAKQENSATTTIDSNDKITSILVSSNNIGYTSNAKRFEG